jgi:phenylacetic acid degradation operon negative regulatory protein
MKPRDLLELVHYAGGLLCNPTFRNLTSGYESFAYRYKLDYHLDQWEKKGLIKRGQNARGVILQLTDAGRQRLDIPADPTESWNANWDGSWRIFLFDLPSAERRLRQELWRWLQRERFGYLQNSVWIRPQPILHLVNTLAWFRDNPETFLLLETKRVAGASDVALVSGAWDFTRINASHNQYRQIVEQCEMALAAATSLDAVTELLRKEGRAYREAMARDPLLPEALWPAHYEGRAAYRRRQQWQRAVSAKLETLAK